MDFEYYYIPYDPRLKDLARDLRKEQTLAEKVLWKEIRKRRIENCLFVRQKPILSFIAVFFCAELLLVIEVDGSSHENKEEMDMNRTFILREYGITVIRYTNDEVLFEISRVISHLSRIIQSLKQAPLLAKGGVGGGS